MTSPSNHTTPVLQPPPHNHESSGQPSTRPPPLPSMDSSSSSLSPSSAGKHANDSLDPGAAGLTIPGPNKAPPGPKSAPLERNPSSSSVTGNNRRRSLVDSLRGVPATGHRSRQPSLTAAAVQDLLNNPPPPGKHADPRFAGREWRDIGIGELAGPEDVLWIEVDASVEEATKLLVRSPTSVVLVREDESAKTATSTFDFNDLNAYLLIVVGLARPSEDQLTIYNGIVAKVQAGGSVSLREFQPLCRKETLINVPADAKLAQAIEVLGGGVHRILVAGPEDNVVGIVSQLRVLDFFWNERVNFPTIDHLYPTILRDLAIGTQQIFAVNSDAPLADALMLMNDEGLTSVAIVDNGQNVVGNISTRDVRHLTSTSSAPLLTASCMHFISVILNERGMEMGQDAVPVFYVNPYSTLAHTVAKLVATRSHRMWVVESPSPSPTAPATPLLGPQGHGDRNAHPPASPLPTPTSPLPPTVSSMPLSPIPASALAGASISGRLSGVISLTDILNVFAKFTGLHPQDPGEQRARRRRSSSSSVRPSIDGTSRPRSIDGRR